MAPEQARGVRDIGPATDLYALGAILYEMLTGRPPFRGASVLETLEQVRDEEPVPPGQFQRQLPRDLETICLKCLQKEPARRYLSAAALADDLARFLAGEPIQARPVGAWERGLKWARRRPLAAALVVVSLAAMVGLVVGAVLIDEKRREADRQAAAAREQEEKAQANAAAAREQEEKARANYERAERSYRLAHAAMEKLLAKLRADPRFQEGSLEDIPRTLLQAEMEFYTQFAEQRGDEPAFKAERAQAYLRLAQVTQELDSSARAVAPIEKALALFTELVRDHPEEIAYEAQRAKSQSLLGCYHTEANHFAEARQALQESLAATKALAAAYPETLLYQTQHAAILNTLAVVEHHTRNSKEAERLWKEARALRQTLVERFPDDPALVNDLAKCYTNLGNLYRQQSRFPEGRQTLTEARRLMKALAAQYPMKTSYRAFLALIQANLGLLFLNSRQLPEAEQTFQEGLALAKPLVDQHPTVPDYRTTLLFLQVSQADTFWYRGRGDAAFALYTEAATTLPPDLARESKNALALEYLIRLHMGRAKCLGRFGRHREAVWEWERVLDLDPKRSPTFRIERACALARSGDHAQATRAADAVVKEQQDQFTLYNAACAYALSVAAVDKGSALAERYGDRAVALLRQAIAGGFRQWGLLLDEVNWEAIRPREDFQQLRRELRDNPPAP
jgi:tetratricopeptide (TPR) repeat protein